MRKNNKNTSTGITLIALVIIIIVLLILAGISIQMLTGDSGILQRARQAKEWTDISQVEEQANLELLSGLIETKIGNQAEKSLAEVLETLKTNGQIEAYGQTKLKSIVGITFGSDVETNGVSVEIGDEKAIEKVATFSTTDPSQDYYVQIKGKKYPIGLQNGKATITKTEITLGSNPTGEITSVEVETLSPTNPAEVTVVEVEKVSETTNKIKITGRQKGTAKVTVKYTEQIKTEFTVTVRGNVSVTTQTNVASTIGIATIMSNATYAEESQISLSATVVDDDYRFDGWYESINSEVATFKVNSAVSSYNYIVPSNATSVVVEARFSEKPQILGTTSNDSGVGYYINKGTTQNPKYAIVFADRVAQQGTTVEWSSTNTSSCEFPSLTAQDIAGFKTYQINGEYTDPSTSGFGRHPVLEVAGNTDGEDRFMALELSNLATSGNQYCWYSSGASTPYMSDFTSTNTNYPKGYPTSKAFLAGKTNTQTMITKWNNEGYKTKDAGTYKDLWGQIQTQYSNGWFVPSFEEWSAFGWAMKQGKLKQNVTSYRSLGLNPLYWSSSQSSKRHAWEIYFDKGYMDNGFIYYTNVGDGKPVRLATTF